jgi:hypothetical protein
MPDESFFVPKGLMTNARAMDQPPSLIISTIFMKNDNAFFSRFRARKAMSPSSVEITSDG